MFECVCIATLTPPLLPPFALILLDVCVRMRVNFTQAFEQQRLLDRQRKIQELRCVCVSVRVCYVSVHA
jgi:hypothetical protein